MNKDDFDPKRLFMPLSDKSTWENVAEVISSYSDERFLVIIEDLLVWLQDMNWQEHKQWKIGYLY